MEYFAIRSVEFKIRDGDIASLNETKRERNAPAAAHTETFARLHINRQAQASQARTIACFFNSCYIFPTLFVCFNFGALFAYTSH